MVLGERVENLISSIGHDGSEIWWPSLPEPLRRRGFHPQELIDQCYFGYRHTVTMFMSTVASVSVTGLEPRIVKSDYSRMFLATCDGPGVLTGTTPTGRRHAVAWDGNIIYDPNGAIYPIEDFNSEYFFRIKSF